MKTTTADKTATRNDIRALVAGYGTDSGLAERALVFCNGHEREVETVVQCITPSGVNMEREELSDSDEAEVVAAVDLLNWMVRQGWMTRALRGVSAYYAPAGALARHNTL